MKLTDLNAEGGIGANSLLIEIGTFRIIVDAGMHPKAMGRAALPNFDVLEDKAIDLVILTHCHLDHLGGLPVLLRRLPNVPVVATEPVSIIASVMLHNSVNVMKRQREEHNMKDLPLYTHREATQTQKRILPTTYGRPRTFNHGDETLEITLFNAGHVAGACGFQIIHKGRKIFFTGDVLFTRQATLPGARFPAIPFDTVVMETTHGCKERPPENTRATEIERLIQHIDHVLSHGGSCLIPVFALGRMQEVLTLLHQARKSGKLRKSPIYCAGLGMAVAQAFDRITRRYRVLDFRHKIIRELKVKPLEDPIQPGHSPSKPGIYVVSSGMMVEHTPSYRVASTLLGERKHSICFVGYCDPSTPGGKLLATQQNEPFLFETLDYSCRVAAHVERFDLSGHAERDELLDFALKAKPRAVVLTHGDPEARNWFADELKKNGSSIRVVDPKPLESYQV